MEMMNRIRKGQPPFPPKPKVTKKSRGKNGSV
jgi:hypothetical protein